MKGNDIRWLGVGALVAALAVTPMVSDARTSHGSHSSGHSGSHSSSHSKSLSHHSGHHRATGVGHKSHGNVLRSAEAKDAFKKQHPCPSNGKSHGACPGYVIDHVTPLKRGGADAPSNMQWQTTEVAQIKDRTE